MSNLVGFAMILILGRIGEVQVSIKILKLNFCSPYFTSLDGYIELPPSAIDTMW
jgi:hypothetical protein